MPRGRNPDSDDSSGDELGRLEPTLEVDDACTTPAGQGGASEDERAEWEAGGHEDEDEPSTQALEAHVVRKIPLGIDSLIINRNCRHGQIRALNPAHVMTVKQSLLRDKPRALLRVAVW